MPPRNTLPSQDRAARSQLARLLYESRPLVRGSLVSMARRCGKPGCRCVLDDDHKHVSLYLSAPVEGKRRMIYVPASLEDRVRAAVEAMNLADQWIDEMSAAFLKELDRLKKKPPEPGGTR